MAHGWSALRRPSIALPLHVMVRTVAEKADSQREMASAMLWVLCGQRSAETQMREQGFGRKEQHAWRLRWGFDRVWCACGSCCTAELQVWESTVHAFDQD